MFAERKDGELARRGFRLEPGNTCCSRKMSSRPERKREGLLPLWRKGAIVVGYATVVDRSRGEFEPARTPRAIGSGRGAFANSISIHGPRKTALVKAGSRWRSPAAVRAERRNRRGRGRTVTTRETSRQTRVTSKSNRSESNRWQKPYPYLTNPWPWTTSIGSRRSSRGRTEYRGWSFGAKKSRAGEVVFNTGMVGYVESLTDPEHSPARQLRCPGSHHAGPFGLSVTRESYQIHAWWSPTTASPTATGTRSNRSATG